MMIKRTKYLDEVKPFIDKPLIKVIIGIRRSGKTVLLNQIGQEIVEMGVSTEQILSINFESMSVRHLQDSDSLYRFVLDKSKQLCGKKLYLFFDEIQEVEGWKQVVNSFLVDIDCDIYLTGSNSNMLSGELATYISGRYVVFKVFPFTFKESVEYKKYLGVEASLEQQFDDYLELGGLPQRFNLETNQAVKVYLNDVFNSIVIKDILMRNKVFDVDLLQRLTSFLLDNVGNTFSANSICSKLKTEGIKTTVATILTYIAAIKNALVLVVAPRFDLKGKELLSTKEKYFATDLGLRNVKKGDTSSDVSKLYENVIFLEMLSRGYDVCVGKSGEFEVDFVATKNGKKVYIQVSYVLATSEVVEREFRPLLKIEDNFPKYVVSSDRHNFSSKGIIHKNIIEFLLGDEF